MIRQSLIAIVLGCIGSMIVGGCSSPKVMDEAGVVDGSAEASFDAGKKDADASSGPMCPMPLDVTNFMPEMLPPPTGKHQNKCTQLMLDTYHKCVLAPMDMTACATVKAAAMMDPWKSCIDCLQGSQITDPQWGPVYFGVYGDPMKGRFNNEGCLNLALNQSGPTSCGQLLHAAYGCQLAACAGPDGTYCDSQGYVKCDQTVLAATGANSCGKYANAFTSANCNVSTDPDGGFPDVDNCFERQNEMDGSGLRVRIDTFFCGP